MAGFKEGVEVFDGGEVVRKSAAEEAMVIEALTLGIRDYVLKSGFKQVLLGLSGGIDSALVATLAVRALGKDAVLAVWLPSPYSSPESEADARQVAAALGIELRTLPITELMAQSQALLAPFQTSTPGWALAQENRQARLRGLLLMALANAENRLLLTTGNKSELAVGYCTLYGDMCGALNPIGDVYKTEVYALARYLNGKKRIFSDRLLAKAPSAELRPNQKDQDTLPPYEVLDTLIMAYMEARQTPEALVAAGFDPDDFLLKKGAKEFAQLVEGAKDFFDYKAEVLLQRYSIDDPFGIGWRYPIVKHV